MDVGNLYRDVRDYKMDNLCDWITALAAIQGKNTNIHFKIYFVSA